MMKKAITLSCVLILLLIITALISGCAAMGEAVLKTYVKSKAEEAKARRQAKYIAEEIRAKNTGPKIGRLVEEHVVGNHTVKVNNATYQGRHGCSFSVFDINGQPIGVNLFYFNDDEENRKEMEEFSRMSSSMKKKQYIREAFLKHARVDLGPIYTPRLGDTAETVLAELGKPDDSIPLYYEEGKVVSEMLIYNESSKKFLAVDITRGKVVKTQEFALQEGQGPKDALASAGITPAAAP